MRTYQQAQKISFSFITCLLLLIMIVVTNNVFAANKSANVIYHRTANIEGLDIYYRETGNSDNPTVILLHGFPTSSHMFRTLIPKLADDYHVIAPDYPGYGNSPMPLVGEFDYTFEHMAVIVEQLISKLELKKYSLYVMDYGAPIGFRIAANQPDRVQSLIIQNGNAYDEGIDNNFWEPIKAYWQNRQAVNVGLDNPWWTNVKNAYKQPNMANEDALRFLLTKGATTWQYTNGVRDPARIGHDAINMDQMLLDRPGNQEIQLQMFYDYGTNPPLYPQWQAYFRKYQPATLIVWGDKDEIFPVEGAHPYKRDLNNVEMHLYDTGHFALEEDGADIAQKIHSFLNRNVK